MYRGFRYRHWPGLIPRTHPCGLAGNYVFVKQSGAPCHCDLRTPFRRNAGTPSPEVTGPICRVPSPALGPIGLRPSQPAHLCRISVRTPGIAPHPLFKVPRHQPKAPKGAPIAPSAASHHYGSQRPSAFGRVARLSGPPLSLARGVRGEACVAAYPGGAGILTGFPFGGYQLGAALGPANRRLTKHCRRTLALSAVGILTPLRCYYRRDLQHTPVHRSSRPGFRPVCAPAYPASSKTLPGYRCLASAPTHFRGPPPRRVSFYALFKGWLLLSLPPRCLRRETPFGFRHLARTWGP